MNSDPTIDEQLQLAETRRRAQGTLIGREVASELLFGLLFGASVAGLWLVRPPGVPDVGQLIACVLLTALAIRVKFQTPFGFTTATQLGFVPLAFTVSPALLPVAVLLALVISRLPEMLLGRVSVTRLLHAPGNCVYALGPAWVFALAGPARLAGPIILVVALAVQFAADLAGITIHVSLTRGVQVRRLVANSWWVWAIDGALSAVALVVAEQMRGTPFALAAVVPLLGLLAMFARERTGRLDKLLELNETYRGTALLLGDVVEADDAYTGVHSQGVVALAVAIGDALGLDPERRRDLEFAALLHDIGKIAIPKSVINKPGRLDPDEWELIKTHAVEGQRMLERVGGFMSSVGLIVRSHHERWDGGGYPDGLVGDAAPLEARIITCADSWSAMRTDRSYREALTHEAAVAELQRNVGSQFDPRIAEALLRVVGELEDSPPDAEPATALA